MAQQAKDIYSGIKKIFPSSRRSSGSFSFSGRSSSSASAAPNLFGSDGEELSAHDADKHKKERKKKERRPSFSFSSWGKDKHRSSSSASGSGSVSGPSAAGTKPDADQVVMSLPYGAQAATPKGYLSPSHLTEYQNQNQNPSSSNSSSYYHTAPARGSLYNEPSASVTSASSKASASGPGHRSSAAGDTSYKPAGGPHAFSSSSLEPPKLGGRSVSVDLTSRAGRNSSGRLDDRVATSASTLLQYSGPSSSSGALRGSRRSRNSTSNISTSSVGPLASAVRASASSASSVRSFSSSVSELAAPTVMENEPLHAPVKRRDSLSVYRHSMSAAYDGKQAGSSSSSSSGGRASLGSLSLGQAPLPASSSVLTPEKPKKKKERRTSLSFTSSRKKQAEAAAAMATATSSSTSSSTSAKLVGPVVKPHASTWDSDSDDDYEDSKRPTRGLDRRSQSMDFMEQAPTHLISKIWRKLPIQARLIGGRGSIDLDLQKDRNSFSRSSSAKQQQLREQQQRDDGDSPSRRPPSPVPDESNVFGDKRIRFSHTLRYFPDREERDGYTALESYDDVLVRVCKFAAHDKRRTATKVQEFLERSMAFLHGTRTKHGNVVSISNEEIRMWRRLALHDWALEETTCAPPAAESKAGKKDKRSSSSVSTAGSDDSDEPSGGSRPRPPAIETMSEEPAQEEDEEEEEEDDEDLKLPRRLNLSPLREVVNCCVGFGERLFSADELDDLVRLEFLVEEDGWI